MKKYLARIRLGSFRIRSQTMFLILAIVMTMLTAAGIIYASFFLVSRINVATTVEQMPKPAAQFDTKGFEKLNLLAK